MGESAKPVRHILGLSGGKDSAALAIYLKENGHIPEIEYFFCDTGAELQETYDYLDKLEGFLGKPIKRLSAERDFFHHLRLKNGFLPSPKSRWCTEELKLKPIERWIGDDPAITYIAIRADENRSGYISTKLNIKPNYPFIYEGLVRTDIIRILDESGVGVPDYYSWRSRSGCYFCFFQRKEEWVGLYRNHPDLFKTAQSLEKTEEGKVYTWSQGETLGELLARAKDIRSASEPGEKPANRMRWQDVLAAEDADEYEQSTCLICHL
jgi:hypothetical protein